MKRALAERAKQSGHPNGLAPPPQKVPRIERPPIDGGPEAAATDGGGGRSSSSQSQQTPSLPAAAPRITIPKPKQEATTSSSASSLPKSPQPTSSGANTPRQPRSSLKRQRPGNEEQQQQPNEEPNGFYLKHQNRALASELKALQHSLQSLEKERDARRRQCGEARQAVQSLEATWTQMEVALQLGLPPSTGGAMPEQSANVATSSGHETETNAANSDSAPMSTGTGKSVELIGALLDSLANLANSKAPKKEEDTDDEHNDLMQIASGVSKRAAALQRWIWTLLQSLNTNSSTVEISNVLDMASLKGEIGALQLQLKENETRIAELAKARDEAANSDRRVRRGLYRLAAGRMQLEEVLKAVEDDDKQGMAALMALESVEEMKISPASPVVKQEMPDAEEDAPVDSAQLAQLKKQLQDLEEVAASREQQIERLGKEREEHVKRINDLLLPKPEQQSSSSLNEDDVKQSSLYVETTTKLASTERQLEEQREKLKHTKEQWAKAKGDAELAMKTLDELQNKHKKRWKELINSQGGGESNPDNGDETDEPANSDNDGGADQRFIRQAQQIIELEHKLKQALENVRQAENVRISLAEAVKMNEGLQAKLDELKAKNALLVAGKSASRANASELTASGSSSAAGTPSSKDRSSSHGSSEKLHRENRKMRKELAAAITSKESAKAKQERAEKERDALVKTNSRLLKQSTEKDDMNAKSLSTILHLKHLTDQLEQEKVLLEQTSKSSKQLALAARLATNAKERVGEEAMKEKKALEDQLAATEEKVRALQQEKEEAEGKFAQSKASMLSLEKDAATSQKRCEELAEEATKREEEKRRLMESLAVAQREAAESAKKFANLAKSRGGGVGSEFTTEELTTQVSVLKGRLACPVCNHRDKKCILLRCRHMFCKQCVEENVRNRSRKCPACGQRFDNKDVADVWL